MKLSNKAYDILKFVAQIVLPGLGTLYFAIAGIWGLPHADKVVGTLAAITTFLGAMLGISTSKYIESDTYGDGDLLIDQSRPDKDLYRLDMRTPLDDLKEQKTVALKVKPDAQLR